MNLDDIDPLLVETWQADATDLMLVAGSAPRVRIDGALLPLDRHATLSATDVERIVSTLLGEELWATFQDRRQLDFSFTWRDAARFRGSCFFHQGSVGLALRVIPRRIPTFEELGAPAICPQLAMLPQGLILVTGPTGSGKSTTLAAMVDFANEHRAAHIVTIEDPVEYVHVHRRSIVTQREVGTDTPSFEVALRSTLREDPDIVLVGELRDLESIQFALTLAETGHLVLATLHTNDVAQAIDRVCDVFPAAQQTQVRVQLASSLAAVVSQRLLPRADGLGRVAAFEVLVATTAMRNLIREHKTHQIRNGLLTGRAEGMCTLETSLSDLMAAGLIDRATAMGASLNPNEIVGSGPVRTPAPV